MEAIAWHLHTSSVLNNSTLTAASLAKCLVTQIQHLKKGNVVHIHPAFVSSKSILGNARKQENGSCALMNGRNTLWTSSFQKKVK